MKLVASSFTRLAVVALAVASALVVVPGAGSRSAVPGRCCFRVSVEVRYTFGLGYNGTTDGSYLGAALLAGGWSTRFIAAFTGRGLAEGGALGDALVSSDESKSADYEVVALPPRKSTHFSCSSGRSQHGSVSSPFRTVGASSNLASAVRNKDGSRGLKIGNPATEYPKCGTGLIEGPEDHGLDVTNIVVPAPSVDNFLGGQTFSRLCADSVKGDDPNPFPHSYDGYLVVEVRFTYFRREALEQNRRALDRLEGTRPTRSDRYREAVTYEAGFGGTKPASCG